ncbi:MAG TPA: hypothetical protein VEL51_08795 [Vicinamibacterales bacterium]|nr:hypothetical protein [Vicinamibacterales bacterium]
MRRILFSVCAAMLLALCLPCDAAAEGRWKTSGEGCYWDQYDSGPNQCGRFKVGGEAGCYWEINDAGPDQCSLISEADFWTIVALVNDMSSITGTSNEDIQAAYDLMGAYGLVGDGGSEDLTDVFEEYENPSPSLTCGQKSDIVNKATKAGLWMGGVAAAGGLASIAAVGLFPPATIPLAVGSAGLGLLAAGMGAIAGVVSGASCT